MAYLHPFRFSAVLGNQSEQSRQSWLEAAHHLEDLGYNMLLVPDHMYVAVDPVPALATVAAETSLGIGSHVFCNDFRHPLLLARQAANLDMFSEGRLRLGLGCGYLAEEYEQLGISLDPVGPRMSRFEEAVRLIKAYFEAEREVNFDGKYYQVHGMPVAAKAVQKPHPPIFIGGGGKRVLSFAAREADIIGVGARSSKNGLDWTSALTAANLEKIAWIREAAGERFEQLELGATIFIVAVTEHRHATAEQIGKKLGLSPEQVLDCSPILIGTHEQMAEELLRRRELLGISSLAIGEGIEAFAPVIALLSGK